jgi:5-methylcytosine-specific restriction protein A
MIKINTEIVKNAISRYNAGEQPFTFKKPNSWYLKSTKNDIYPLKYIYAIATNQEPNGFHTYKARAEFEKLLMVDPDIGLEILEYISDDSFEKSIEISRKDTSNERVARLKKGTKKPKQKLTQVFTYVRNPDVVAEVLFRAAGICQNCETEAPFRRKSNNEPYLEVHHIHKLSEGGDDTLENAIALCPNCHREAHYG